MCCVPAQEAALLKAVKERARLMLARCFQKYYAVSDAAATGIMDGDIGATDSPPPVLHHAVLLAGNFWPSRGNLHLSVGLTTTSSRCICVLLPAVIHIQPPC